MSSTDVCPPVHKRVAEPSGRGQPIDGLTYIKGALVGAFLVAYGTESLPASLGLFCALFAIIALRQCRHVYANSFIILYLLSFFLFLTGRLVVVTLVGYRAEERGLMGLNFSDSGTVMNVILYQAVFLVAFDTALWVRGRVPQPKPDQTPVLRDAFAQALRSVSVATMLLSAIPYLLSLRSISDFVSSNSYYDYYLERAELLTTWGRLSEALFSAAFAGVLASMPSRQLFLILSSVYLGVQYQLMNTGRRSVFVLAVLLVIGYAMWRFERERQQQGRWISRRTFALAGIAALPLVSVLNRVSLMRGWNSASATQSPADAMWEFLYSQGVSANLLGYVQDATLGIPSGKLYTLGPLFEFTEKLLGLGTADTGGLTQSATRALDGHQLAHTISYLVMPDMYLRGAGYGSSSLAELLIDFGVVGLVVGGAVTALLLKVLVRGLSAHPVRAFVSLLMLRDLLFTPRAPFLHFLVGPFSTYGILAASLILGTALLLHTYFVKPRHQKQTESSDQLGVTAPELRRVSRDSHIGELAATDTRDRSISLSLEGALP